MSNYCRLGAPKCRKEGPSESCMIMFYAFINKKASASGDIMFSQDNAPCSHKSPREIGYKNILNTAASLEVEYFLPRDAIAERGYEIAFVCLRLSVRL